MVKGTIARLVTDKRFGFIARTGGDVDYFFHESDVEGRAFDQLHEGLVVSFEESEDNRKGPRAKRVVVAP